MRVVLVTARFRARAPFDLTSQVRSLAPALARAGAEVEVFCGVGDEAGLPAFSQRRAEVIDHVGGKATFGVTTIALGGLEPGGLGLDAAPVDFEERLAEGFGGFLDRERPDVVHFERLDVFGTPLVREACARNIRTVYCASDTWPAHDRASMLLPNLEPFELGDGEAEARALLVEAEFGVRPLPGAALDEAQARRVRHLLTEPLTELEDVARLREASEAVEHSRGTKRAALSAVDRRFATTRLLAKNLSATVGRAFTFRAAGVDTSLFPAPDAPREVPETPRLVALGDTSPEGGVDVLLEALSTLESETMALRPVLVLECSDAGRDAEVARRAQELEVETRWTRGPSDVHGALRDAHVVVETQRWGEVLPSACQVALASGVPVVVARTPGATEGVSSTAGHLVTPADAGALAAALRQLTGPDGTLPGLMGGAFEHARGAKSVDDEAREWLDTYKQLVREAARPRGAAAGGDAPAGPLAEVEASLTELRSLSHAELFTRAQEGIGKLRRAFGLQDSEAELLTRVVARGGLGRDRAMAEARTLRDLEATLADLREAREIMRLEDAARGAQIAELTAALGEYEAEVLSTSEALSAAESDLESARSRADEVAGEAAEEARALEVRIAELEASGAAQEEILAERERALEQVEKRNAKLEKTHARAQVVTKECIEALDRDLEDARRAITEAEEERAELARTLEEREELASAVRERIGADAPDASAADFSGELASIEAFCAALERDTEELRRHDAWMGDQAERLRGALGLAQPEGMSREAFEEGVDRACEALRAMTGELDWRRSEMAAARRSGGAMRAKLLAGPLARRVAGWETSPSGEGWAPVPLDTAQDEDDASALGSENEQPAAEAAETADAAEEEPRAPLPGGKTEEGAAQ